MIEETLAKAANGDAAAFAEVVGKFAPLVASEKNRAIGKSPQFSGYADEISQEALMALYSAVTSYDPEKGVTFGSYAKVCIRNRIISYIRKLNTRLRREKRAEEASGGVRGKRTRGNMSNGFSSYGVSSDGVSFGKVSSDDCSISDCFSSDCLSNDGSSSDRVSNDRSQNDKSQGDGSRGGMSWYDAAPRGGAFDGGAFDGGRFGEDRISGGESPENVLMAIETDGRIRRFLETSATAYERKVITLYFSGMSAKDVAARVGRDEKSVTNAIYRVRSKMKKMKKIFL